MQASCYVPLYRVSENLKQPCKIDVIIPIFNVSFSFIAKKTDLERFSNLTKTHTAG